MFASVVLRGCWPVLMAYCSAGQAEGIPAHRMQHVETARAAVARQNIRGGVTFRMADVQARAAGIGEHVEDVKLGRQLRRGHFAGKLWRWANGCAARDFLARIEGAKSLLLVPNLLPFGLDQMKRILSAAARHRTSILPETESRGNRGI